MYIDNDPQFTAKTRPRFGTEGAEQGNKAKTMNILKGKLLKIYPPYNQ